MIKNFYATSKMMLSKYRYELSAFVFLTIKLFKYNLSSGNFLQLSLRLSAEMILLVFVSIILGKIIRDSDGKIRETLLVLTAFFFVSYMSNSILLLDNWYIGVEAFKNTYAVLCFLLVFVLIDKPKIKWLIPFLCFSGIAVQPVYTIIFLPMTVILFVYEIRLGENRKESTDLFASTSIASVLALLIFGLKIISTASDIRQEWAVNLKIMGFSIAIMLPFSALMTAILIITRRESRDRAFRHIIMLLIFEPVISLLTFCTVKTNMNLVMSAIFVQFCFVLYFVKIKNPAVIRACEKVHYFIVKNPFALLLAVIYLASFSSFFKTLYVGLTRAKDFNGLWS